MSHRTKQAKTESAVGGSGAGGPRVFIKAHVVRLNASGAKAASLHLRYIEGDGVEQDGSKGALYGPDGPALRERFEQPLVGEHHQFQFIVSPEHGRELELTDYVRRLMGSVERNLGRALEWAAVNHYDAGHPHAHIVIRGVDKTGRNVRIDRADLAEGLRHARRRLPDVRRGVARPETTYANEKAPLVVDLPGGLYARLMAFCAVTGLSQDEVIEAAVLARLEPARN